MRTLYRFFIICFAVMLLGACKKYYCPAYYSVFLSGVERADEFLSVYAEDTTPRKAYIMTQKNKFGIIVKKKKSQKEKKHNTIPGEIRFSSIDSTKLDSAGNPKDVPNYEQIEYDRRFGTAAKEQANKRKQMLDSLQAVEDSVRANRRGLFGWLFKRKKNEQDSTQNDSLGYEVDAEFEYFAKDSSNTNTENGKKNRKGRRTNSESDVKLSSNELKDVMPEVIRKDQSEAQTTAKKKKKKKTPKKKTTTVNTESEEPKNEEPEENTDDSGGGG